MLEKILTKDGSFSFYDSVLKETYHSRNGALTESLHVYISNGLKYWLNNNPKAKSCKIFEMGFGTGLNAILTKRFAEENKKKITYSSIEKSPLNYEQIRSVRLKVVSKSEKKLLKSSWDKMHEFAPYFKIHKIHNDFFNLTFKASSDLIFYDAFSYDIQPIMWSEKALKISTDFLKKNGIWVSYCAKGVVRRRLEKLGLSVERIPGPPGKRVMLRAIKN